MPSRLPDPDLIAAAMVYLHERPSRAVPLMARALAIEMHAAENGNPANLLVGALEVTNTPFLIVGEVPNGTAEDDWDALCDHYIAQINKLRAVARAKAAAKASN